MAKLWGSRFKGKSDPLADCFSFSLSYDYRLAKYDCLASMAHAKMLGKCGIIKKEDADKIVSGLKKIEQQISKGTFEFDKKSEDIHSHIQTQLKKLIGVAADKLHTARSRNDLIVCDMKLYCIDHIEQINKLVIQLQKAIVKLAEKYKGVIVPAYTHLQSAQVVQLSHHLLAYAEMLERDKGRLYGALKRMNENPLGSCALSGSTLPIDRDYVTQQLKFGSTSANSMDSVSDRDFIVETLSHLALLATHYSRIAEDFIIWATSEFSYIDIDWTLCTGSSIMPHKKNPDMLELIRGEAATVISNLNQALVLLKGLPLTYNRDLQLDKPPLFESVDKIIIMTQLLTKTFTTLKVNEDMLYKQIHQEALFSVDIMEYLIAKGVSYRKAHDTVGELIKGCVDKGKSIKDLKESQLKKYHPKFSEDVKTLLNPKTSVKMKQSLGSTSPASVAKQISDWKKKLKNA